jgi:drug/metabolite transporter (DMT)-like permease
MEPSRAPVMGATEWTLLLALSTIWGGSFFLGKVALSGLPPLTVALGRVGVAALALNLAVLTGGGRMLGDARAWRAFFAMGALNNLVPFSLILWGQTRIASGLASILNATTPLFAILVAHLLTRDERMTGNRLAGVLIGLAGVAAMVGPDALGHGGGLAGELACLGAALSYAFAGVYGRRFRAMGLPPLVTAAGQVTATTAMLLPLAAVVDRPWTLPAPGVPVLAAVLTLALLCTALAYVLYFRILAAAGATNLLLVTLLVPAGAILLGATFLGERLAPRHVAGMTLIALGLAAIDGRPLGLLRSTFQSSAKARNLR